MLSFASRKAKATLTGLRNIPSRIRDNKKALAKFGFRLFVFLFAIAMGMVLVAPMQFPVRQGDLSYQLALSSRSGGYVQFSLGPIGSVNFHTHAIPINLKMNLVLNRDITTGQDLPDTFRSGVKKFKYDAVNAFIIFLASRVAIIAIIGFVAGIMLSNGGEHWFKKKFAVWGLICFVAPAGVLIGISYITLNRTPDVSYTGEIAQDLSKAAPYVEKVAGGYRLKKNLLQNFVEGAVILNNQMNSLASSNQDAIGARILVASDIHDNIVGTQIAGQIVSSFGGTSAVILAGDITNGGYSWESHLFDGFSSIVKTPIYFIGGNHEDSPAMKTFRQMGFKLLDSQVIRIDGVTIIGQSDPTAYSSSLVATPTQLLDSSETLAGAWYTIANPPDMVVVHNIDQAKDVINLAKTEKRHLTVVYGHDHAVSFKSDGTVSLVDCGTGGASGLDGISRNTVYTFQVLDFSADLQPRLIGIWTLEFYSPKHIKSMYYHSVN